MKNTLRNTLLITLFLALVTPAHAWGRRYHSWAVIDPLPAVVLGAIVGAAVVSAAQPAEVTRPVQAVQPVAVPDYVPASASPRDYRQVLANFHTNTKRLQRLLDRQLAKGGISQEQYDRQAGVLDQIVLDERKEAYDNGGNLTPRQIDELDRRLNGLREEIQEDLAS